jgi:hypothetical protein
MFNDIRLEVLQAEHCLMESYIWASFRTQVKVREISLKAGAYLITVTCYESVGESRFHYIQHNKPAADSHKVYIYNVRAIEFIHC